MRIAATLLAGALLAAPQGATIDPLARAHAAIGGADRIAAVRSLLITGESITTSARPLEVRIAFPDRFVRLTSAMRSGFSGDTPIHVYPPPPSGSPVLRTPVNWVAIQKVPLVRWLLGMFADPKGMMALKLVPAPGDPNLLLVTGPRMGLNTGPKNFAARIDLDAATGMPLRVRYMDHLAYGGSRDARDVEVTISFEDRRVVDGLMLPHRIVRRVNGESWEVVSITTIKVNPPFTDADFR